VDECVRGWMEMDNNWVDGWMKMDGYWWIDVWMMDE
jgi:hypothetical protein